MTRAVLCAVVIALLAVAAYLLTTRRNPPVSPDARGTTRGAVVAPTANSLPASSSVLPAQRSPWIAEPRQLEARAAPAELMRDLKTKTPPGDSPCAAMHGRWQVASGGIVVLEPGGRAQWLAGNAAPMPMHWICHKSGTLDLMLPDGFVSLRGEGPDQLVAADPGDNVAPLTRQP